jgi:hypothetical protein
MNTAALRQLFSPRSRRRTLRVLAAAVLIAAVCWYLGANLWHSIVLACVISTVCSLGMIGVVLDVSDIGWRAAGRRSGSRNDVAQLSGSLRGSGGRVDTGAIWRARQIARQRLARHGLDYREPAHRRAIEQLIGRRPYAVIVNGERRRPMLRTLLSCLDALDALNQLDPLEPPAPVPVRARQGRHLIPSFTRNRARRAREL